MNMDMLKSAFETGYDYNEYRTMVRELFERGEATGPDQSESMLKYTDLNMKRMDRGEKTIQLTEELKRTLDGLQNENWLVLTEGWCGDAAQILPALDKMEKYSDSLQVRYVLRDEHPKIMDAFLTDGTRGIPKVIRLNADLSEVLGEWGPRPKLMHQIVLDWKRDQSVPKHEMYVKLHGTYARDRGNEIMKEFSNLLEQTR